MNSRQLRRARHDKLMSSRRFDRGLAKAAKGMRKVIESAPSRTWFRLDPPTIVRDGLPSPRFTKNPSPEYVRAVMRSREEEHPLCCPACHEVDCECHPMPPDQVAKGLFADWKRAIREANGCKELG